MRARTNFPVKEKRKVELSDFRGMDFSSSVFQASPFRACEGVNWEPVNGINRKRRGWEQVLKTLPARINGIFPYTRASGEEELIVYAGIDFYRISLATLKWEPIPTRNTVGVLYWERLDRRCQGFLSGGYLYFVGCGIFLRYGEFDGAYEVRTVDPYVPTTTVGIGCSESADSAREARDPVNLLTPKRKNTLFGHHGSAKWFLDGAIASNSELTVEVSLLSDGIPFKRVYTNSNASDRAKLYNENGVLSGSISFFEGSIALLDATQSPSEEANITVLFTATNDPFGAVGVGDIGKIYSCAFGTLFGVGGTEDRLFLSGNPEYPNTVFFSERRDFSYFPDQFTVTPGTDGRAVTGLLPLSDSTMAIFKEHGEAEGVVYYMKGEYRSFYTEEGDLKRTIPVFSVSTAGVGESPASHFAVANLAGEPLFLSKHGVFGIEYSENIISDVRVTRERSRKISKKLLSEPLSDAVATVHGERLYFAVGTHCYVTERRYRYRESNAEDTEYEWWYWENFPARVFATVEDEIWFGTENGRICRLYEGYADRSFQETLDGELSFAYGSGKLVPSDEIVRKMGYGTALRFLTEGVMAEVTNGCLSLDTYRLYVEDRVIDIVYDGLPVYVATLGTSSFKEGKLYYICDTDRAAGCFSLTETVNGRAKPLYGLTSDVRVYTELTDRVVYVGMMEIDGNGRYLRLTPDGQNLKLANYFRPMEVDSDFRVIPTNPICRILSERPVHAHWKSPMMDLGTSLYTKDLIKLTLCAVKHLGEIVTVGYETERGVREFAVALPSELALDGADLESFTLERGSQEILLKRIREKNVQNVCFFFSSDTATPTEILSVGAIYKINKMKQEVI